MEHKGIPTNQVMMKEKMIGVISIEIKWAKCKSKGVLGLEAFNLAYETRISYLMLRDKTKNNFLQYQYEYNQIKKIQVF